MGLFSKKDEVPQLPPAPRLPALPSLPESSKITHELPSLPENLSENLNREMVKSAVGDSESEPSFEELSEDFKLNEEPRMSGIPKKLSEIPVRVPVRERKTVEISRPVSRGNEPVFVRIDKFQTAQRDFEEVKKTVKEIGEVIMKIHEERAKEEAEVASWEADLDKVKSKLSDIDSNIFDRI